MSTSSTINESTKITIGLVAGLVVAVFWAGTMIGRIDTTVDRVVGVQDREVEKVAGLDRLTTSHEARLTAAERTIGLPTDKVAKQ